MLAYVLVLFAVAASIDEVAVLQLQKAKSSSGKYQVLLPKPATHSSGSQTLHLTGKLGHLKRAARQAGRETWKIFEAQFLSRLPLKHLPDVEESCDFKVILPRLPLWRGSKSWQPIREA